MTFKKAKRRAGAVSREIGRRIRAGREKAGLSCQYLAFLAGYSHGHVSELERGLRGLSVESLYEYAAALGVDPQSLLPDPVRR